MTVYEIQFPFMQFDELFRSIRLKVDKSSLDILLQPLKEISTQLEITQKLLKKYNELLYKIEKYDNDDIGIDQLKEYLKSEEFTTNEI